MVSERWDLRFLLCRSADLSSDHLRFSLISAPVISDSRFDVMSLSVIVIVFVRSILLEFFAIYHFISVVIALTFLRSFAHWFRFLCFVESRILDFLISSLRFESPYIFPMPPSYANVVNSTSTPPSAQHPSMARSDATASIQYWGGWVSQEICWPWETELGSRGSFCGGRSLVMADWMVGEAFFNYLKSNGRRDHENLFMQDLIYKRGLSTDLILFLTIWFEWHWKGFLNIPLY